MNIIKQIHDFQYYTGAEPRIKKHFRSGNRPKEFGNKVWQVSLILIDYLQNQSFDKRLRVLEIGCGWGLPGVFMAKKFGCKVTCSDFDPTVMKVVELHAELNDCKVKTLAAGVEDLDVATLKKFDLIIGSEICYSDKIGEMMMEMLLRAKNAGVKEVMISDPGRPNFEDYVAFSEKHFRTERTKLPGSKHDRKQTWVVSSFLQG